MTYLKDWMLWESYRRDQWRDVRGYPMPKDEELLQYDLITNPRHYTHSHIEVSDAIMAWKLNWHLGNVVKYVARAGLKGHTLQDLKKAREYLEREIKRYEPSR